MSYTIPIFKEVYKLELIKTGGTEKKLCKTVCELISVEGGEQLSFGLSRVMDISNYNVRTGKIVAYGNAMRFLFLKLSNGKINVDDQIPKEYQTRQVVK